MSAVEWGTAGITYKGQVLSGDRALVVELDRVVLLAVIDGLGHGHEAAEAAAAAARVLEAHAGLAVSSLVELCHHQLRRTRGVVVSLVSFDVALQQITWLGVGNVEGILVRADPSLLADASLPARGGTVGYQLPPLRSPSLPIAAGDTLVLATDGVRSGRYKAEIAPDKTVQDIASQIIAHHAKGSDDACVLVARFLGADDAKTRASRDEDIPQASEPDVATRVTLRKL